jgi:hypothetical protein
MTAHTVAAPRGASHEDAAGCVVLALAAVDAARAQLARYAFATDSPAWQAVEVADQLDAAHDALAGLVGDV